MNTRRSLPWKVLLALLVALLAMTAVAAQESTGTSDVLELVCNVNESEPNNTMAAATPINVNDVACGNGYGTQVDLYRFHMATAGYVIIELQDVPDFLWDRFDVHLVNSSGKRLSYDYRADTSWLLFENLYEGDYYAVVVTNKAFGEVAWSNYKVTVYSPLLISASATGFKAGGTIGHIHFYAEDILAHADLNNGQEIWRMFLDGSQAGNASPKINTNVVAIAAGGPGNAKLEDGDDILFTMAGKPYNIYVYSPVGPGLWIGYCPPQGYGFDSEGWLTMGLEGNLHELTTTGEKLDAIDGWVNGHDACYGYPVSTVGDAQVSSWNGFQMKQNDEDVFCKVADNGYGPWRYFFDVKGKNNAPKWWSPAAGRVAGMPQEDVLAMAYNDATDVMYLTIQGSGVIMGNPVTQKDIFAINFPGYTWGGVVWHGPDHGWNYDIDAIEWNGP